MLRCRKLSKVKARIDFLIDMRSPMVSVPHLLALLRRSLAYLRYQIVVPVRTPVWIWSMS
jgi:hypothetical protein